jgi:teichuronic acid biosynthesis glycosyltransferase TuaC
MHNCSEDSMKILIVTAIYPTAENPGFGSFVRCQEQFLRRSGVDVDVLVLKGKNRKLIYPKGIVELRRRLEGVSLVHAHYAYVGAVARTQWKVPVVLTYHGDDALGTISNQGMTTRKSRIISACCRNLARYCDAAIVQSSQMASRFRHGNIHIIPHEVDFETFQPTDIHEARAQLGLSELKKYVLFAANPTIPVKRYSLARDAINLLQSHATDIELVVVHREPQARLALYMSACDALVFPSYQEGSPNIVKQAMACNLPIVATDVGDVREVIGNTAGCYISEPDPQAFAKLLGTILASPFRTAGRENVKHLSGPLVAERLIQVYKEVLQKREAQALFPQEI